MKKAIKIKTPPGYEAYFDNENSEVKFKEIPKNVLERITCFDDVLKEFGIEKSTFDHMSIGLEADELGYRKVKLICRALNEDWTPDWIDGQYNKYYPWFNMGSPSGAGFAFNDCDHWRASSVAGSRLCFKSRELAEYAGKTFEAEYKEFLTIQKA